MENAASWLTPLPPAGYLLEGNKVRERFALFPPEKLAEGNKERPVLSVCSISF